MSKVNKWLTLEQLVTFCQDNKFYNFSSEDSGYTLSVQVPATFSVEEVDEDTHRGMTRLKFRLFHTKLNKNGSYISKESAEKAMKTIADRPLLAAIHKLDDDSYDFEGHEMQVVKNKDGETEIDYIEKQVGSFTSEEPFWEHDDELDKDYVCAYAYVADSYTKAAEIIKNKKGTDNSVELCIENLRYNVDENYLELVDFYVSASTLLGSHDDGTPVLPGMEGSCAEIVEFSTENNSVKYEQSPELVEVLEKLNNTLSNLNINTARKEEGIVDNNEIIEGQPIVVNEAAEGEQPQANVVLEEKFTKTFEISHEDIRVGLYGLLEPVEEADNEWYYITDVYDDHFAYETWDGKKIYGQKYAVEESNVTFVEERYILHKELLTDAEYAELTAMRSNYASISEELAKFKAEPQKLEILNSKDYEQISHSAEFEKLMKQENHFDLSVEEITKKADEMLLAYAKNQKLTFAANEPEQKTPDIMFANVNHDASFLDKLLKK